MANQRNPSIPLLSPVVRLSYPKLINPESYMENGQPKGDPVYTSELLVPEADLDKFRTWDDEKGEWRYDNLNTFCAKLSKKRFGADFDIKGALQHSAISWPVQSAEKYIDQRVAKSGGKVTAEQLDHYLGHYIVRGKALSEIKGSPNAPTLYHVDGTERKVIARGTEQGKQLAADLFYGGAWVVVDLTAVSGTAGDNKYVTLYINSVIFIKHGDRFGGGANLMDRFEGVKGGASDYDPTAGMDEDIAI